MEAEDPFRGLFGKTILEEMHVREYRYEEVIFWKQKYQELLLNWIQEWGRRRLKSNLGSGFKLWDAAIYWNGKTQKWADLGVGIIQSSLCSKFSCLLFLYIIFLFLCFLIYLSIFYYLAALGLRCCTRAFSSCGERGLLFIEVHGLLIAVASTGSRRVGFSSCGTQAQQLWLLGSRAQAQ